MKVLVAVQDSKCVEILGTFMRNYPWPTTDTHFKVMHVVHPVLVNSYMSLLPAPLTESMAEQRAKEGAAIAKQLADALRVAFPSSVVEELVVEGDAKAEIVDELTEWDADLALLGSHAKSALVGSVSRAVVAHSPCSAMIVPVEQRDRKKTKEAMHIIV